MAKGEQFESDVKMLKAVYVEEGKASMLVALQELCKVKGLAFWIGVALLDGVYHALVPGDTREARLERNRLAKL